MCCNYCLHFVKCKKAKKLKSKCCKTCAEYDFCPAVNKDTKVKEYVDADILTDTDTDTELDFLPDAGEEEIPS